MSFMENEFFLNAGIPPPPFLFEQVPSSSSSMPTWQSVYSAMEIQVTEQDNCPSVQSPDCFFNPNWEKSTNQSINFDSALSSLVSSPTASNSKNISNESFVIRELIGKLGNIGNSAGISPHSQPLLASYINGNNSTNTSCYSTPLNSPPKLNLPMVDHLVKEKIPNLGKSMPLSSSIAEFSADPGFAERAARFSRFGSRSFNGRTTTQFVVNNSEFANRSNLVMGNGKLPRVSSSPSLKAFGLRVGNKNSPLQDRPELENSQEESTVSEQIPNGDSGLKASNGLKSRKRKAVSKGKSKESTASPSVNATKVTEANDNWNAKRSKPTEGNGNENSPVKTEEEAKGNTSNAGDEKQSKANNNNTKPPEPPKDYIHVRARRGQATDSHSLAERVRREKISERMKLLQDLVPGCNKVIGKALMLDEIINYVQSLQRQVEFLSMKLASVNTSLDFNVESLMSKDVLQSNNPMAHTIFPLDTSATAFLGHQTQQNPAIFTNISNGTMPQCSVDPLNSSICRNFNMQLPSLEQFTDNVQYPTFCEDDLQTIVQMGFAQNPTHGTNQISHMKLEL